MLLTLMTCFLSGTPECIQIEKQKLKSYSECYYEAKEKQVPLLVWVDNENEELFGSLNNQPYVHCFLPADQKLFNLKSGIIVNTPEGDLFKITALLSSPKKEEVLRAANNKGTYPQSALPPTIIPLGTSSSNHR